MKQRGRQTPARKLPASHAIAMTIIYVYVARIGATMDLSQLDLGTVGAFVAMAYFWIFIHGAFVLAGAYVFRVDVHTLAIASAASHHACPGSRKRSLGRNCCIFPALMRTETSTQPWPHRASRCA